MPKIELEHESQLKTVIIGDDAVGEYLRALRRAN